MEIITGYRDEPHVTSQQERDANIALYGTGVYILNVGSKLAATVISANEIEIADGLVMVEGCTAEVERGTTESIAIDNGEQGMLRKDLIVVRYSKNTSTNVEDMEIDIIKGTPATANPATPEYTEGSIADGDILVEFPIYEINLNGIAIQSVKRLAEYKELANKSVVDTLVTKMGTGTLNTVVKNVIGAINEVFATLTNAVNRVTALETKTAGVVRVTSYNVASGATDYKQLVTGSTYMLIINTAYPSDTMKGIYLVGIAGTNAIGIKTVNNATNVVVSDAGDKLLRVKNNGNAYLRCTLITTYTP